MNKEIKHALEVCKRVMQHACEVGDSDWSVYSGFREARQAIEAAEQSVQADGATCPTHGEPVSNLIHFACGCSQEPPRQ